MATAGKNRKSLAVTIVSILLGLLFLLSGGMKLAGGEEAIEAFVGWGYPIWFMYLTGMIEVIGAVLLLIPATRFYGATLLACTMAGATITHLRAGETGMIAPPLVLLVLTSLIAWARCPWLGSGPGEAATSEPR